MANIHYTLLDVAISMATKSGGPYRVGAVADGNHGFKFAHNLSGKSHPMLQKLGYSKHSGQHAEFRLVTSYPGPVKGATVYVARINKLGIIKAARPCPVCEAMLRKAGVRKVVYTTPTGAQVLHL